MDDHHGITLAQAVFLLITKYNSDSLYHICMLLIWLDHSSNQCLAPWLCLHPRIFYMPETILLILLGMRSGLSFKLVSNYTFLVTLRMDMYKHVQYS